MRQRKRRKKLKKRRDRREKDTSFFRRGDLHHNPISQDTFRRVTHL
jgi:hypothetical protein